MNSLATPLRPGRGEGLLDHVPGLCLFRNIAPEDIQQGALGNVWLVAAIAAVAEMPQKLRQLFKQTTLAPDGRYDVQLFHPLLEKWVTVSVDDRLAVNLKGEGQFMQLTNEVELWPCILEKAIAKLFGSYQALDGTADGRGFPGLQPDMDLGEMSALALEVLTGSTGNDLVRIVCEDAAKELKEAVAAEAKLAKMEAALAKGEAGVSDSQHAGSAFACMCPILLY